MIFHAITFELRAFLRQPGRWLLVAAYIACGLFAIIGGREYVTWCNESVDYAHDIRARAQEGRMSWFETNDRDTCNLWYDVEFVHMGEPPIVKVPVATTGISHGVADFLPRNMAINLWTDPLRAGGPQSTKIENPECRIKGGLDLVFVFVFLMPLVMIILCYDISGYEIEQGMLPLLSVQVGSPFRWMLSRVLAVTLGIVAISLGLIVIAAFVFDTASQLMDWAWLLGVLLAYAAVWTALIVMVLSFQRSSSESALMASLMWLTLCMLIPALLAQQAMAIEANDFGVDITLNARGDGSGGQEVTPEQREQVFEVLPHLKNLKYDPGSDLSDEDYEKLENGLLYPDCYPPGFALHRAYQNTKIVLRHRERLKLDDLHLGRLEYTPWLSPGVAMQSMLERLSGVGLESTIGFRKAIIDGTTDLAGITLPAIWQGKRMGKDEFEKGMESGCDVTIRQAPRFQHMGSLLVWFLIPVVITAWNVLRRW